VRPGPGYLADAITLISATARRHKSPLPKAVIIGKSIWCMSLADVVIWDQHRIGMG
jgi:hypothetical protein